MTSSGAKLAEIAVSSVGMLIAQVWLVVQPFGVAAGPVQPTNSLQSQLVGVSVSVTVLPMSNALAH
jgi:hypothetical protein